MFPKNDPFMQSTKSRLTQLTILDSLYTAIEKPDLPYTWNYTSNTCVKFLYKITLFSIKSYDLFGCNIVL